MQNIANQREIIRSQITWFAHRYLYCSGNWKANVLVTEIAQYSALHCFFDFKQNDEYLLISNTLRFICSILLAIAFYFILHVARHNKNYIYLNMKWLRLKRNKLVNGLETSELLYSSSFCIKRKNFLTFAKVQNFTRFHEFPKTFFHSRFHSLVIFTPSESHFRLVA